ncbi:MAG: hypothetical protein ACK55X_10210 [Synechococcaceae cyanobacterium]
MPVPARPSRIRSLAAATGPLTTALLGAALLGASGGAAVAGAAPTPASPGVEGDPGCRPPATGRWVVMEQGSAGGEPVARLRQERWHADGRLEGVLLERRGRGWRERAYVGQLRPAGTCRVTVERLLAVDPADARPREVQRAGAVLDRSGRPAYSLDLAEGTVLSGRWWSQADGPCAEQTLGGVVLSQQQGLSWRSGAWQPNAVVQRELWRAGRVEGVALMSVAGRQELASYGGSLRVAPSCLATIQQKDSQGVLYNYRAVLLANGGGYVYLQTDPDDLTIGWLEHR